VIFGVRPESVEIGATGVEAEVIAVTPLNERTVLLLQNPNGWELLASLPSTAANIPEAGAKVRASFAAAGTHIFDRQTGSASMAELDIRQVDKIYHSRKGDVHAVKAFDLVVKPGEIVALLGSSGCGKTSTLRMIAGFEEVSNGAITLGGKPIYQKIIFGLKNVYRLIVQTRSVLMLNNVLNLRIGIMINMTREAPPKLKYKGIILIRAV
jgi:ABC-type sugar transport system ATPase subunit